MMGPCAKLVVRCTIVTPDGHRFVGENECANPQPVCPRLPGEGYDKCINICRQNGHAEEVALRAADVFAVGARAYIEGHTHVCRNCQEALVAGGVDSFSIGPPPEQEE